MLRVFLESRTLASLERLAGRFFFVWSRRGGEFCEGRNYIILHYHVRNQRLGLHTCSFEAQGVLDLLSLSVSPHMPRSPTFVLLSTFGEISGYCFKLNNGRFFFYFTSNSSLTSHSIFRCHMTWLQRTLDYSCAGLHVFTLSVQDRKLLMTNDEGAK
jgi:hypothetical protein